MLGKSFREGIRQDWSEDGSETDGVDSIEENCEKFLQKVADSTTIFLY